MKAFHFHAVVLALAFALCLALPGQIPAKGNPPGQIDIQKAAELIDSNPDDLLILDVRTPAEYRQGHIKNARNMDFFGGRFDMDVAKLPKDKTVLLYCRTGRRSAGAAEILRGAGIRKVLDMHEGMVGWEKAKLPLEKSD